MLIRGENFNSLTLHFMLIVCQINDLSNPIACFIRNENFDPREAYKRGTLLRVIHISLISNHNKSKSNRNLQCVHSELFNYVDQVYFL